MTILQISLLLLAGFVSGIAASMGLGGGFVLLLLVTWADTLSARSGGLLNLLFFLPVAAFSIWRHHQHGLIVRPVVKPAAWGGLLGILCGFFLAPLLPEAFFTKGFGFLSLALGVKELFFQKQQPPKAESPK